MCRVYDPGVPSDRRSYPIISHPKSKFVINLYVESAEISILKKITITARILRCFGKRIWGRELIVSISKQIVRWPRADRTADVADSKTCAVFITACCLLQRGGTWASLLTADTCQARASLLRTGFLKAPEM